MFWPYNMWEQSTEYFPSVTAFFLCFLLLNVQGYILCISFNTVKASTRVSLLTTQYHYINLRSHLLLRFKDTLVIWSGCRIKTWNTEIQGNWVSDCDILLYPYSPPVSLDTKTRSFENRSKTTDISIFDLFLQKYHCRLLKWVILNDTNLTIVHLSSFVLLFPWRPYCLWGHDSDHPWTMSSA